jgi:hypothetical protein
MRGQIFLFGLVQTGLLIDLCLLPYETGVRSKRFVVVKSCDVGLETFLVSDTFHCIEAS